MNGYRSVVAYACAATLAAIWPSGGRESIAAAPLSCLPKPDCKGEADCCKLDHMPDIDFAIRVAEMRRDMYADASTQDAARQKAFETAKEYYENLGIKQNPDGSFNFDDVDPPKDGASRDGAKEKERQDLIENLENELESKSGSNLQKAIAAALQSASSDYNTKLQDLAKTLGATVQNYESSWTTDPDSCKYSDDGNKAASDREGGKYCSEVIDASIEHEKWHSSLCQMFRDDPNSDATHKVQEAMGLGASLKTLLGTAQDERAAYAREALALREQKLRALERCLTFRKKDPDARAARDAAAAEAAAAKKAFDDMTGGQSMPSPQRKDSKSGPHGSRRPWDPKR